jgi:bifunctional non-homologous end joining protein LigD
LYINPAQGVTIGNVTIPPNRAIPAVGAVVEIRYLYAYQGGALYQPVYLGERDDVPAADCTVEKQPLKYKAENPDVDPAGE